MSSWASPNVELPEVVNESTLARLRPCIVIAPSTLRFSSTCILEAYIIEEDIAEADIIWFGPDVPVGP